MSRDLNPYESGCSVRIEDHSDTCTMPVGSLVTEIWSKMCKNYFSTLFVWNTVAILNCEKPCVNHPVTVCKTTCRALLSPSFSAENNKFIRQLLYFSTRAMVLHKICSIILVQGNLRGGECTLYYNYTQNVSMVISLCSPTNKSKLALKFWRQLYSP